MDRQALHAAELDLIHPYTAKKMHFEIPLPQDMQDVLAYLREHSAR